MSLGGREGGRQEEGGGRGVTRKKSKVKIIFGNQIRFPDSGFVKILTVRRVARLI